MKIREKRNMGVWIKHYMNHNQHHNKSQINIIHKHFYRNGQKPSHNNLLKSFFIWNNGTREKTKINRFSTLKIVERKMRERKKYFKIVERKIREK